MFLLSCAEQETGSGWTSAWALSSITIFHDLKSYFRLLAPFFWGGGGATHFYTAIDSCFGRCGIPCTVPACRNDRGVNKTNCRLWKQKKPLKNPTAPSSHGQQLGLLRSAVRRGAGKPPHSPRYTELPTVGRECCQMALAKSRVPRWAPQGSVAAAPYPIREPYQGVSTVPGREWHCGNRHAPAAGCPAGRGTAR